MLNGTRGRWTPGVGMGSGLGPERPVKQRGQRIYISRDIDRAI